MIESIRRYASSWVVKGLFMVLVLSFVLWGVADVFRPGARKEDWVAQIDGTRISSQAFAREYDQQARRIRSGAGARMTADDLKRSGLPHMVIDRMITTRLLDAAADRLGLTVTSETASQAIAADPRFRNTAGQFDPEIFRQTVQRIGMNEAQYLALEQSDIRRAQIVAGFGADVAPPKALSDVLARYLFEQRTARYVTVPLSAATEVGTPDAAQLKTFYDENPGLFTAPEYRKVSAIILDATALAKDIKISQQDLEAAYAKRADEFSEPERRSFIQLVFGDEAAARDAESKLASGADFADVGEKMLGETAKDITFTDVKRDALPGDLAATVFSLAPGIVSAPVHTTLGWHIVKVTAVKPASQRTLDEVRETLASQLQQERAVDQMIDMGNRLDDAIGRGLKLEDAAHELKIPITTFDAIDPDGQDRAGQPVAGLPQHFVTTAFATGRGEESTLIEAGPDAMFMLRVDDITPSTVKPFDGVQKEVTEAWRANRRIELARQRAEGLAARIRSDSDFANAVDAEHLSLATTPPLSRAAPNAHPDVPRPVFDAIFAAGTQKTFVARGADAFYVGRLDTVTEPAADALEKDSVPLNQQLSRALGSDVTRAFFDALRAEHDVQVNEPALDKAL
jgi:peptidyl-prolyl cis-trans isomerase D